MKSEGQLGGVSFTSSLPTGEQADKPAPLAQLHHHSAAAMRKSISEFFNPGGHATVVGTTGRRLSRCRAPPTAAHSPACLPACLPASLP